MYLKNTFIIILMFFVNSGVFAESRVALVIGNSNYKSAPLRNPVNDATDMAVMLEKYGFDVTVKTDLDHQSMDKVISNFGKRLKKADIGLFFYAGHAIQLNGNNYLLPIGADIDEEEMIPYRTVNAGVILAKMEAARNKVNIIILDACRNNPFARSFSRGSATRGLVRVTAPTGSMVVYATAPNQTAADGKGRNGIFTQHLLQSMAIPNIDLSEVIMRTRIGVIKATNGKQVPWNETSLTQKFFFYQDNNTSVVQTIPIEIPTIPVSQQKSIQQQAVKLWNDAYKFDIEVEANESDGSVVFYAEGTSNSTDIVSRKIASNKAALNKVRKFLFRSLSRPPHNMKRSQINALFERGELVELEYLQEGKVAQIAYQIQIDK